MTLPQHSRGIQLVNGHLYVQKCLDLFCQVRLERHEITYLELGCSKNNITSRLAQSRWRCLMNVFILLAIFFSEHGGKSTDAYGVLLSASKSKPNENSQWTGSSPP